MQRLLNARTAARLNTSGSGSHFLLSAKNCIQILTHCQFYWLGFSFIIAFPFSEPHWMLQEPLVISHLISLILINPSTTCLSSLSLIIHQSGFCRGPCWDQVLELHLPHHLLAGRLCNPLQGHCLFWKGLYHRCGIRYPLLCDIMRKLKLRTKDK